MAIPLRLMLPPVALVITRLLPDRMIPAGSGTLGDTVGEENVGCWVGSSVQAPHMRSHLSWSEKSWHSAEVNRAQYRMSLSRQVAAAAATRPSKGNKGTMAIGSLSLLKCGGKKFLAVSRERILPCMAPGDDE